MYKNFFGLNRNPFELSPDPFFMFPSKRNQEALASIYHAIIRRKGFAVLTGEVGTGKTLVVRSLCESLKNQKIAFANVIGPRLSVIDFLSFVTFDLGITVPEPSKGNLLRGLYRFLLAQFEKGLTTVLVIDEAHQMPSRVLEEIRMLTNFETTRQKLLQVLFVGQPEFETRLDSFELRQLKQRVAIRCRLEPLSEEETCLYIERRLTVAGANSQANSIFPKETAEVIFRYSSGLPRLVNNICEQALVAAYARQVRVIPPEIIDEVACYFRLKRSPDNGPAVESFSLAEHGGNSIPEISWRPTSFQSVSVEQSADPATFSTNVYAFVAESAEDTPPGELETPFNSICAEEYVETSATTSTVTNGSAIETDTENLGAPESETYGGSQDLTAPIPAQEILASTGELLSSDRVLLEKASGSKFWQNWRLIAAGIVLLFGLAVGGKSLARWRGVEAAAGSAIVPPTALAATNVDGGSITQTRTNLASSTETQTAERKHPQLSAPAPRSAQTDMAALSASLNAHPTSLRARTKSTDVAPPLDAVTDSPVGNTILPDTVFSSNVSVPSRSDPAMPGPGLEGGQTQLPRLISSAAPVYPLAARLTKTQGEVVIRVVVDQNGKVGDMQVVSGPPNLRQAALDAVRKWRYEPRKPNEQPLSVPILVAIRFHY